MTGSAVDSRSVVAAVQVFRGLIRAYPHEFLAEYGEPMVQVFRDACRKAYREGAYALVAFWVRTAVDLVRSVIEERSRRGVNMTREKFYKLSGWAMIIGPFLFLVGWLANGRPEYHQYNAASIPIDRYAHLAAPPLVTFGLLFISLGLSGMLVRYGSKGGSTVSLGLGLAGGLVSVGGAVWMILDENAYGWILFFVGLFTIFLAITLFGVINLRSRLLPRWNGLPLMAGLWVPAFLIFSGLLQFGTGTPLISNDEIFIYLWGLSLLMFVGLGYLLLTDALPVSDGAVS